LYLKSLYSSTTTSVTKVAKRVYLCGLDVTSFVYILDALPTLKFSNTYVVK